MTRLRAFAVGFVFAGLGIVLGAQVTKFPAAVSGASSITCQASVTLTDAQIKALPTTAVTVLAPVGASNLLIPIVVALSSTLAGDYTNIDGDTIIGFDYAAQSSMIRFIRVPAGSASTILTGAGSPAFGSVPPADSVTPGLYTSASPVGLNAGLNLSADNFPGDFTGGNAANTLKASVLYSILNTTTGVFQACP